MTEDLKSNTQAWMQNESIEETRNRIRRQWGDYPLTILIINPINLRLVRWLGHTKTSPNQVTLISFVITLLGALCLCSLSHVIQAAGGFLLLAGYIIDCLDGDLARFKNLKSPLGAMLDPTLDRFGEMAIIGCASIGGFRTGGDPEWLVGGMLLIGLSQMYFYLVDAMVWKLPRQNENGETGKREKGLYIKGTRVRIGVIEPFMWGQALMAFMGIARYGVVIFNIMFVLANIKVLYNLFGKAIRVASTNNESDHFGVHTR